jgi:magnesium-transporting ATPase (P-type)
MSNTANDLRQKAAQTINGATSDLRNQASNASNSAASLAKQSEFSQATLIFAVLVSVYFVVFSSMSINEGLKKPENDDNLNKPLATISIITLVLAFVLIMLVPLLCVSRSKDNPTSTTHIFGAAYSTLVVSLFMSALAMLSILGSYDTPNSVTLAFVLKMMGGVGVFAALLVFIFGTLALVGTSQI